LHQQLQLALRLRRRPRERWPSTPISQHLIYSNRKTLGPINISVAEFLVDQWRRIAIVSVWFRHRYVSARQTRSIGTWWRLHARPRMPSGWTSVSHGYTCMCVWQSFVSRCSPTASPSNHTPHDVIGSSWKQSLLCAADIAHTSTALPNCICLVGWLSDWCLLKAVRQSAVVPETSC